jgi:hypothetical protein
LRTFLLALILAAFPAVVHAAAGTVIFAVGKVTAIGSDGRERPLSKGADIDSGDTIVTAPAAQAQVRFTDEGYVSLQPDTRFRVDEYRYTGKADGTEKGFFSLVKGGLRAITGAIGRVHRPAYRLATPAAAIGIRGTSFTAVYGNGLTVTVSEGAVSVSNRAGELVLVAGQTGFVKDEGTKPRLTVGRPAMPAVPLAPELPPVLVPAPTFQPAPQPQQQPQIGPNRR